jgi:hypothetical protein
VSRIRNTVFCGEGCTTPISELLAGLCTASVDPCQYRSLTTRPMIVLPILPPEQYQYRRLGASEYSSRMRSLQVPVVKQAVQNSCGPHDNVACRDDCCGTATGVWPPVPASTQLDCLLRNGNEWEWYRLRWVRRIEREFVEWVRICPI